METERRLKMLIMAAADSLEELRKVDVMRVVESANTVGLVGEMKAKFENERPDLVGEFNECLMEVG